jgi:hypothetical protein
VARRTAQERLKDVILSIGAIDGGLDTVLRAMSASTKVDLKIEPWMADELRRGESAVRRLRIQVEQQLAGERPRGCARCGHPVTGRADRKYCSDRCRQAAHQHRRARSATNG